MRLYATLLKLTLAGGLLAASYGCANDAQTGALIGGAAGAGIGGIIGNNTNGRTGQGALIGGAAGAVGGYIVGNEMDKSKHQRDYHSQPQYSQPQYNEPQPGYYEPPPRYQQAPPPPPPSYERSDEYRRYEGGNGSYGPVYERRSYERYDYSR